MNWNGYKNINNKELNINNHLLPSSKITKSIGINDLTNYKFITRNNIDEIEIGSHIKYIKNVYDTNKNKFYEKIYNGGFLLEIINSDKIYNLTLVLKSNIIWKMKFIKYKVYSKSKTNFVYNKHKKNQIQEQEQEQNQNIEKYFRNKNKQEIDKRKQEIDKYVQEKINLVKNNKNKHFILFKNNSDNSDNSDNLDNSNNLDN
jgi:hypothetical protein